MSGFDFDSLRDPRCAAARFVPPRRGRSPRAHELRSKMRRNRTHAQRARGRRRDRRRRRNRRHATGQGRGHRQGLTTTRRQRSPTTSSIDGRFIRRPPIDRRHRHAAGDVAQRRIVHGAISGSAEDRAARLRRHHRRELGGRAGPAACCSKQVASRTRHRRRLRRRHTGAACTAAPNGEAVPVLPASQALKTVVPEFDFLVFQFGPWLVQVYDLPASLQIRSAHDRGAARTLARSLTGTVDANGYLRSARGRATLPRSRFQRRVRRQLRRHAGAHVICYCGQPGSDTNVHRRIADEGGSGVAWCAGDLHIVASGTSPSSTSRDDRAGTSAVRSRTRRRRPRAQSRDRDEEREQEQHSTDREQDDPAHVGLRVRSGDRSVLAGLQRDRLRRAVGRVHRRVDPQRVLRAPRSAARRARSRRGPRPATGSRARRRTSRPCAISRRSTVIAILSDEPKNPRVRVIRGSRNAPFGSGQVLEPPGQPLLVDERRDSVIDAPPDGATFHAEMRQPASRRSSSGTADANGPSVVRRCTALGVERDLRRRPCPSRRRAASRRRAR